MPTNPYNKQKDLTPTLHHSFPIATYLDLNEKNKKLDCIHDVSNSDEDKCEVVIAINNQIYDTEELDDDDDDDELDDEGNVNSTLRNSIYDNVPSEEMTMLSKSTPNDVKFAIPDNYFDLTLKEVEENMQQHHHSSEDEDDDCSISSQEEIFDDTIHHLNLPGHMEHMGNLKISGMGSVDSGVPSSPVMRSPR